MQPPRLILALLATFCFATAAQGQTIKSLGYNTTNGQVVYSGTNTLTFTNVFNFSTNTVAAQVRTNLGLGAAWLTNTNAGSFRSAVNAATASIWAYKTNNQTNDTANLVADDALTFVAQANTKYAVELFTIYHVPTNAATELHNIDGKINASSAQVYGTWTWIDNNYLTETHTSVTNRAQLFQPLSLPLTGSRAHHFVVVGATNTNATVTFEFAKYAGLTNAGDVVIEAGSYLKATIIE